MGGDQWTIIFTDNVKKNLGGILAMEEEDINFAVKISIPNKVVICWVVKGDFCQGETITKVIEEVESGKIIRVGVGISS